DARAPGPCGAHAQTSGGLEAERLALGEADPAAPIYGLAEAVRWAGHDAISSGGWAGFVALGPRARPAEHGHVRAHRGSRAGRDEYEDARGGDNLWNLDGRDRAGYAGLAGDPARGQLPLAGQPPGTVPRVQRDLNLRRRNSDARAGQDAADRRSRDLD